MKRNFSKAALLCAIVAAGLTELAVVSPREAGADPLYYGYSYGGRFVPAYGGYVGYGYTSSYGYANPSPGPPIAPSYRGYGIGNGFGTGGTYRGVYRSYVDHAYGTSRQYVPSDRPAYSVYGSGGYTPYGYRMQHDYGY